MLADLRRFGRLAQDFTTPNFKYEEREMALFRYVLCGRNSGNGSSQRGGRLRIEVPKLLPASRAGARASAAHTSDDARACSGQPPIQCLLTRRFRNAASSTTGPRSPPTSLLSCRASPQAADRL